MIPFRLTVSCTSLFLILAGTGTAYASGNDQQASQGIVDEAKRWLSAAAAGPTVGSDTSTVGPARDANATAERRAPQTTPLSKEKPFVDFSSPNVSLVARDWRGSFKLVGDRTLLVDDLRPTASNRLVVVRLATDARLTTFAQLGVGEWRIDPTMFPNARSYSEVAGQVTTGFELRLPSGLRVAGEAQYTALYHDLHYGPDEVAPRIVAFVVAIDGRF
jgi:hypothetical protein